MFVGSPLIARESLTWGWVHGECTIIFIKSGLILIGRQVLGGQTNTCDREAHAARWYKGRHHSMQAMGPW